MKDSKQLRCLTRPNGVERGGRGSHQSLSEIILTPLNQFGGQSVCRASLTHLATDALSVCQIWRGAVCSPDINLLACSVRTPASHLVGEFIPSIIHNIKHKAP